MRIIVLFKLKPGAGVAAYEHWATQIDRPGVNALGSVEKFTVHRATGLFGSDAPAPYDYIEVIDIKTMDGFVADISSAAFQAAAAPFHEFADNPQFILTEDM